MFEGTCYIRGKNGSKREIVDDIQLHITKKEGRPKRLAGK